MGVLLAVMSAAIWGVADFVGGVSARRMAAAMVTVVSQAVGLVLLAMVAALFVAGAPTSDDLVTGAVAGACGGAGLVVFYWAMSRGQISVVAPVSAVLSMLVPVTSGLVMGDRPPVAAYIGIALAFPAILMVSREPTPTEAVASAVTVSSMDHLPAAPPALQRLGGLPVVASAMSGIGFGAFFTLLSTTSAASGLWPLVSSRGAAVVVAGIAAVAMGATTTSRSGLRLAVLAGTADVIANSAFLLATRQGLLTVVAAVGGLYPASTVLLARTVLRERLAIHQLVGMVLAVVAVVLIATA